MSRMSNENVRVAETQPAEPISPVLSGAVSQILAIASAAAMSARRDWDLLEAMAQIQALCFAAEMEYHGGEDDDSEAPF